MQNILGDRATLFDSHCIQSLTSASYWLTVALVQLNFVFILLLLVAVLCSALHFICRHLITMSEIGYLLQTTTNSIHSSASGLVVLYIGTFAVICHFVQHSKSIQ